MKHVEPYTDAWRHHPACYLRRVAQALGTEVTDWWQGPCDPRQATILLAAPGPAATALVWDEESGWCHGRFESGGRDRRTVLSQVRYLGGGVLPRPDRVPAALAEARAGVGNSTAWRPCYRSYHHYRDGFDLALDHYTAISAASDTAR